MAFNLRSHINGLRISACPTIMGWDTEICIFVRVCEQREESLISTYTDVISADGLDSLSDLFSCCVSGQMVVAPIGYGLTNFYTFVSYDTNYGYADSQTWRVPIDMEVAVSVPTCKNSTLFPFPMQEGNVTPPLEEVDNVAYHFHLPTCLPA